MEERPATMRGGRLESLTGLRFFAAFLVFGQHSLHYGAPGIRQAVFGAGMAGVSFFFILSGLVLAWTARDGDTVPAFYRRRVARIYPSYLAAWLVSLVVLLASGRGVSLLDFLPATLLQSWVPSEAAYFAANAVFWSLSCEAFFYLVFPLIFRRVSRQDGRRLVVIIGSCIAVVFTTSITLAPFMNNGVAYWFLAIFPPMRLLEFVIGIALGVALRRGGGWYPPLWAAVTLATGAYLASNFVPVSYARVSVTLIPFVILLWSAAHTDLAGRASIFRGKIIATLGLWSYCFYLIHTQAMTAFFEVLDRIGINTGSINGLPLFGAVCGAFACSILASWLLHRFVETPMEKRLRTKQRVS